MEEGWERPPRVELAREALEHLIDAALPGAEVAAHAVLATGLANTNIRFRLVGHDREYVLRLHTRDGRAAAREHALMQYLAAHPQPTIPVPALVYSDPAPRRGEHPYSIWEFVEGTLLQELFATLPAPELVQIARACGTVLAAIGSHRFPRAGAFGAGLEIVEEFGEPSRFVPAAVRGALFRGRAGARLGAELRDELWSVVERAQPLLGTIDGGHTLVHADYKRSNLLVKRVGAEWTVAAVLDWEFACAGPPLIDVGLFLRAGERLPAGFREAFASSYRDAGGYLPSDWLPLSRLVDLISQMTFLNGAEERPRVFADTIEVVKETIRILS